MTPDLLTRCMIAAQALTKSGNHNTAAVMAEWAKVAYRETLVVKVKLGENKV